MKKIQYSVFILGLLLGMAACTERYDVQLDEGFTRLVVDGVITSDSLRHKVKITTSGSYFLNEAPPAVEGATVLIEDGVSTWQMRELPTEPGVYEADEAFAGKPGMTYTLHIELQQQVGNSDSYTATNRMPETVGQIDSITLDYRDNFDFYLLNLYATDPPTTDFYKFDAYVNGRIITDTASRALVSDDRFFNGNNTNGLPVMFLRGDEIKAGDTIVLRLAAINEDYYRFFLELQTASGPSNPLFSGPAANVRSNVSNGGLGYFAAIEVTRDTLIVPANPKE